MKHKLRVGQIIVHKTENKRAEIISINGDDLVIQIQNYQSTTRIMYSDLKKIYCV